MIEVFLMLRQASTYGSFYIHEKRICWVLLVRNQLLVRMPITPAYSWSETPTWVTVEILLQSVSQSALDIITTDCYIKLNCLPYFFQADLFEDVDSQKSSALVDKSVVKFFLLKKFEGMWGRLTRRGDRKLILERRQQSLDAAREAARKTKEEAKAKICHIRRVAVGSQMKLDEVRRNTIEARKEAELLEERHTLNSWKHELDKKQETDLATKDDTIGKSFTHKELLHEWDRVGIAAMEGDAEKTLIRKEGSAPVVQQNQKVEPKGIVPAKIATLKSGERILPAPRRSFKVFIAFTPKVLPNHLPARQSREKQLQLKKHSPVSNDVIDVSEREPLFLQDKGDKFYSGGDYPSAINAYTDAIRKDASLILCYANRAACYLQMNQMQACIGDCTRVVELLGNQVGGLENNVIKAEDNKLVALSTSPKPIGINKDFLPMETLDLLTAAKNPAEASEWNKRVKSCILSRRGCAKAHLRDFADALVDLREALAIDSSNTDIHRVLGTIATELY